MRDNLLPLNVTKICGTIVVRDGFVMDDESFKFKYDIKMSNPQVVGRAACFP